MKRHTARLYDLIVTSAFPIFAPFGYYIIITDTTTHMGWILFDMIAVSSMLVAAIAHLTHFWQSHVLFETAREEGRCSFSAYHWPVRS